MRFIHLEAIALCTGGLGALAHRISKGDAAGEYMDEERETVLRVVYSYTDVVVTTKCNTFVMWISSASFHVIGLIILWFHPLYVPISFVFIFSICDLTSNNSSTCITKQFLERNVHLANQ